MFVELPREVLLGFDRHRLKLRQCTGESIRKELAVFQKSPRFLDKEGEK